MKASFFIHIFLIIYINTTLYGQPINHYIKDVTMPAPNASSLGKYGDIPVSYFTGVPNINIPIYTIQEGSLTLPISLSYHSSGIKVGEMASWVGLGWTLNAGGIITRTVMGIPDEDPGGYYYNGASLNYDVIAFNQVTEGTKDSEPDIFTFNISGYSGKFFFDKDKKCHFIPQQDLKIAVTLSGGTSGEFSQFMITTPDGIRHTFSVRERILDPGSSHPSWNTWYLSKIESHDLKHEINFNYVGESYTYQTPRTAKYVKYTAGRISQPCSQSGQSVVYSEPRGEPFGPSYTVEVFGKRLSSITYSTGTIEFLANTQREDMANTTNRLDFIRISNGSYCKRFDFKYDIFKDNSCNDPDCKRLQLQEVKEQSCDGTLLIEPYKFEYEGGIVGGKIFFPKRLSKAIDHWGYYNGESANNNIAVNAPPTTVSFSGTAFTYGSANRNTNESEMMRGVLKKIIYPTGGNTEFKFEANTSPNYEIISSTNNYLINGLSNCTGGSSVPPSCCTGYKLSASQQATISNPIAEYFFTLTLDAASTCSTGLNPEVEVEVTLLDGTYVGSLLFNVNPGAYGSMLNVPLSSIPNIVTNANPYRFRLVVTDGVANFSLYRRVDTYGWVNTKVGGLRVKEIKTHDGFDSAKDIIKTYEYIDAYNPVKSSGYLSYRPNYGFSKSYTIPSIYGTINASIAIIDENTVVPLSDFQGYHIGYKWVAENHNGNGKKNFTYFTENLSQSSDYPHPTALATIQNGELEVLAQLNGSSTEVSKTTNTPLNLPYTYASGTIYKALRLPFPTGICTESNINLFEAPQYSPRTGVFRLLSKTEILDGVSTTTTYTYGSSDHLAPTAIAMTNSDGKVTTTKHKYVFDWATSNLRTEMINRNLIGTPVETTIEVGTSSPTQVSGSKTDYSFFDNVTGMPTANATTNSNPNHPYPHKYFEKFTSSQQPILRETVEKRDALGNMVQAKREHDQSYSIIWSNNNRLPGAKVINALHTEVAYTSFETIEPVQGGWALSSVGSVQSNASLARTGNGSYGTSGNVNKVVPTTGKYIVSYYTTSPNNVSVSGGTLLSTRTSALDAQNWQYVERIIQCSANATVTVTLSNAYIDEVRLYPSDALMTTYTFQRDTRLMTASTNESSIPTLYEYDALMRLQGVRNFNQAYLQVYEYLYKNTSNPNNAVKSWTVQQDNVTNLTTAKGLTGANVKRVFQYLDGLGRPIQTIGVAQSPILKDVVSFFEYDAYGREVRKYLPYTITNSTPGALRTSPGSELTAFQTPYYGSADAAYSYIEYEFDNSPLNRVLKERPPGNDFRTRPKEMIYGTNTSSTEVRNFMAGGYYATNSLFKMTAKDENGNSVITYTDKIGRKVMVNNASARTYYLYNDFGNIIAVITPEGSKLGHTNSSWLYTHASITPKSFSYTYDSEQRMTGKIIPGSNAYTYAYDRLDRLVLTIDGTGFKTFTKYDILNRPIMTGKFGGSINAPNGTETLYESKTTSGHFYTTTQAYPQSVTEIYTVTYYDNYNFDDDYSTADNTSYLAPPSVVSAYYDASAYAFVRGKVTGTKVGVLKQDGSAPTQFLATYTFYDKWGRVIQTKADNHVAGQDYTWNQYNFSGWLLRSRREHTATVLGTPRGYHINQVFGYDHAGRNTHIYHQIGDVPTDEKLIAVQSYNEKDELSAKSLHHLSGLSFLQTVDYKYNIRGWLTDINDFTNTSDLFTLKLTYGNGDPALRSNYSGGANSNWNGNITMQEWKVKNHTDRHIYGYFYDTKNRLTWGFYSNRNQTTQAYDLSDQYSSSYSYDDNGNILTSNNNGLQTAPSTYSWIDGLTYTYAANGQLTQIADSRDVNKGFVTQATGGTGTYTYDGNGNMTRDNHKKMTIAYNYLNLPRRITYDNGNWIEFTYDAAGMKLRKTTNTGTTKNYAGGIEYSGSNLEAIYTSEGRATPNGASYRYEYSIKDHLGNGRVYFSDTNSDGIADILQESHQHPFGMEMEASYYATQVGTENGYKYNGKELNEDFGLNWYDYGARWYDPAIGRWGQVDPLAEKYYEWSPYNYVANNPIIGIDPNGMDWIITTEKKDGTTIYRFTLNAVVYNNSGSKDLDINTFAANAKSQIENVFSTANIVGANEDIQLETTVNIRSINDLSEAKETDHVITIESNEAYKKYASENGGDASSRGYADAGGLKVVIPLSTAEGTVNGTNKRTIAHELGHTLSLYHPDHYSAGINQGVNTLERSHSNNVMWSDINRGTDITKTQIEYIYSRYNSSFWYGYGNVINQRTQFTKKNGKRAINYRMQRRASFWD